MKKAIIATLVIIAAAAGGIFLYLHSGQRPADTHSSSAASVQTTASLQAGTKKAAESLAPADTAESEPKEETLQMKMEISGIPVSVEWEQNEAVEALKELCKSEPLSIQMSMYGGFEQVGDIGTQLPRNDSETTTNPGDIVLYSGDKLVVFYGSNSWSYTRLGHITDSGSYTLDQLLGEGDTAVTISFS